MIYTFVLFFATSINYRQLISWHCGGLLSERAKGCCELTGALASCFGQKICWAQTFGWARLGGCPGLMTMFMLLLLMMRMKWWSWVCSAGSGQGGIESPSNEPILLFMAAFLSWEPFIGSTVELSTAFPCRRLLQLIALERVTAAMVRATPLLLAGSWGSCKDLILLKIHQFWGVGGPWAGCVRARVCAVWIGACTESVDDFLYVQPCNSLFATCSHGRETINSRKVHSILP